MRQDKGWTYILANGREGMLYTGATPDLVRRIWMHREGIASHFTRRHHVTRLVWYEPHLSLGEAAHRREQIRYRRRQWKMDLISAANPEWLDLFDILTIMRGVPHLRPGEGGDAASRGTTG